MTNKEAIKILQVAKAEIEWYAPLDYQEAFSMAIEALEKQMPKKFKVYHEEMFEDVCACPVCDRGLYGGGDEYCPGCGQNILWED